MDNKTKIILVIIGIVIALFVINSLSDDIKLGVIGGRDTYSGGVTNASSTVTTTASSILSRNVDRIYAKICNAGSGIVYIHEIATTTGVTTNTGFPIASSTVYEHCYTIDNNHHYIGQVYGIANVTTSITYIEK